MNERLPGSGPSAQPDSGNAAKAVPKRQRGAARAAVSGRRGAGAAPFLLGQRAHQLVGPLALHDLVLHEMRLTAHAESFQDARDAVLRTSRRPMIRRSPRSSNPSRSMTPAASVA